MNQSETELSPQFLVSQPCFKDIHLLRATMRTYKGRWKEARSSSSPQSVPPQLCVSGRQCAACRCEDDQLQEEQQAQWIVVHGTAVRSTHCNTAPMQCSPVLHRHAIIHQHNQGKQSEGGLIVAPVGDVFGFNFVSWFGPPWEGPKGWFWCTLYCLSDLPPPWRLRLAKPNPCKTSSSSAL